MGEGPAKILFVASMHGNEVGTTRCAFHLLHHLSANTQPSGQLTIFIIPCLNPDGQERARRHPDYFGGGRNGRFNANDVDLNRNFPTRSFQGRSYWTHGKDYQERTEVFCGHEGGSEPETKALTSFIEKEGIRFICALHNAGKDVLPGITPPAQELAALFAKTAGYRLYSEAEWQKLGQTGTFKEWCDERQIIFLEIEGATRWGSDWKRQGEAFKRLLEVLDKPPLLS